MANIFRGKVEAKEVFPYPYYLNEEDKETLSMVIDPVSRFFTVSSLFIENHLTFVIIDIKSIIKNLLIFDNFSLPSLK